MSRLAGIAAITIVAITWLIICWFLWVEFIKLAVNQ